MRIIITLLCSLLLAGPLAADLEWTDADLAAALEAARANRHELESVLRHYEAADDPQKLEAARFLIANMPGHQYVEHGFFTEAGDEVEYDALDYPNYNEALAAMDALEASHGPITYRARGKVSDVETITAEYLIENIDLAFDAWRSCSWAGSISFEAFAEHVLPYRGSNEPLNAWRAECRTRLADVTADLADPGSLAEAGRAVLGRARGWVGFSNHYYLHPTDQGFDEMLATRRGRCEDMTNMMTYACRANAVLVAADYTPFWANRDNNHAWEVLLDEHGVGKAGLSHRAAKVYRKMYSKQPGALGTVADEGESVPRWLAGKTYKDVTGQYMATTDVTVALANDAPAGARFAYACVFNGGAWRAIHWGRIEGSTVTFSDLGRNVVYLPAYYVDETIIGAGAPFVLTGAGALRVLGGSAGTATISFAAEEASSAAPGARPTIHVKPDQAYELFVWETGAGDWASRGTVGTTAVVPAGGLYWLVRDGSRKLERPFTIEHPSGDVADATRTRVVSW